MTTKIQTARQPRFTFDRNSPLGRFWHWWSGELIALVPQWLQQSGTTVTHGLLIEVTPQAVVLYRWLQGSLTEQGRIDRQPDGHDSPEIAFRALFSKLHKHNEPVALWLTETQYLVKQIELPLAAAKNLRQVLGFEMDRHTPFNAEQVYFDFRVLDVNNPKERLTIKLVVVPRPEMDKSLDLLERWGAPANAAFTANTVQIGDAINLIPAEHNTNHPSKPRGIHPSLLLLTLFLATTAVIIPLWQKHQAVVTLQPIVDRAKQQAKETDALRHEQEKLAAEYNFLLDKKQATPPLIILLDELSRLLPDDTWVQQFNLKGQELQIQGETGSSSKLIALIENTMILHDANFRSPLTKGNMPNSEHYHLVAKIMTMPPTEIGAPVSGQSALQPYPPISINKPDSNTGKSAQAVSESNKLEAEKFNSPLPLRTPPLKPMLPASNSPVTKGTTKAMPNSEAKP
jgi:general secretion pathway protein L